MAIAHFTSHVYTTFCVVENPDFQEVRVISHATNVILTVRGFSWNDLRGRRGGTLHSVLKNPILPPENLIENNPPPKQ
jgi:hypothetical protein